MQDCETIARLECRATCDDVVARLPFELRLIIYEYLICEFKSVMLGMRTDYTKDYAPEDDEALNILHRQHMFSSAYVGPCFHDELRTAFYTETEITVHVLLEDGLDILAMNDPFGTGVPISSLARKIKIIVDYFFLWHQVMDLDVDEEFCPNGHTILDDIELVVDKRCKINFDLESDKQAALDTLMQYVEPRADGMRNAGFDVSITTVLCSSTSNIPGGPDILFRKIWKK